jgi:hypothetical protein
MEFWRAALLEDVFNTEISDPRQLEEKEVSDEQLVEGPGLLWVLLLKKLYRMIYPRGTAFCTVNKSL